MILYQNGKNFRNLSDIKEKDNNFGDSYSNDTEVS